MILAKTKSGKNRFNFCTWSSKSNVKTVKDKRGKENQVLFNGLTTSKLRNLMEQVNRLYTIAFNSTGRSIEWRIYRWIRVFKN